MAESSAEAPSRVDEGLVELHLVDREAPEIPERRVARAEVVDAEPHAERLQRLGGAHTGVGVLHQHALGDLDAEPAGIEPRPRERAGDEVLDVCVQELARRQVDRDREAALH